MNVIKRLEDKKVCKSLGKDFPKCLGRDINKYYEKSGLQSQVGFKRDRMKQS